MQSKEGIVPAKEAHGSHLPAKRQLPGQPPASSCWPFPASLGLLQHTGEHGGLTGARPVPPEDMGRLQQATFAQGLPIASAWPRPSQTCTPWFSALPIQFLFPTLLSKRSDLHHRLKATPSSCSLPFILSGCPQPWHHNACTSSPILASSLLRGSKQNLLLICTLCDDFKSVQTI